MTNTNRHLEDIAEAIRAGAQNTDTGDAIVTAAHEISRSIMSVASAIRVLAFATGGLDPDDEPDDGPGPVPDIPIPDRDDLNEMC